MPTPSFLALILSLLLAAPALPSTAPSPTRARATPLADNLPNAALRAGVAASPIVFAKNDVPPVRGASANAQSNRELRTICLADCERELQQCQSDRRAGVHTQNCSAILDACTDVCWVRWPPPPPPEDDNHFMLVLTAVGIGALLFLLTAEEEESE